MADDGGILPLLLLAGAGYFLWKNYQRPSAAGATSPSVSGAWVDPETVFSPSPTKPATAPATVTFKPPAPAAYIASPPAPLGPSASVFSNPAWNAASKPAAIAAPVYADPVGGSSYADYQATLQNLAVASNQATQQGQAQVAAAQAAWNEQHATGIYCGPGCVKYYDSKGNFTEQIGST